MKENQKIFTNSLVLYVRLAATTIIGLVSSRIVIANLGAEDFGLFSVVGGIIMMMNFLNVSMLSTSFRFIAFEIGKGTEGNPNRVFNITLLIHVSLAILFIAFAETLGIFYIRNYLNIVSEKVPDAIFIFRVAIFSTVFSIVGVPFQGVINANEKFTTSAIIEILRTIMKLVVALSLILYAGNKLRFFSILMLGVSFLPTLMIMGYCFRHYLKIVRWKFHSVVHDYKEMLKYSGWIMLGAMASIGQTQGAALIINIFFGTVMNAAYGISNQLNNYIFMFSKNLSQAAVPQITKSYSGGDSTRTLQLVNLSSKYSFFLMLLPAIPIMMFMDFILDTWLVDVPEYTTSFATLMIINGLIISLGSGFDAAIQATGKIKYYQLFYSLLSIIMLPVAYAFYQNGFPPYTINIIFIFGTILAFIGQLITLQTLTTFKIKIYISQTVFKVVLVLLSILPLYILRSQLPDSFAGFLIFALLSTGIILLFIGFIGLSMKERNYLTNLSRSLIVQIKLRFQ